MKEGVQRGILELPPSALFLDGRQGRRPDQSRGQAPRLTTDNQRADSGARRRIRREALPSLRPRLVLTETGQHALSYAEEIFSIGQDLLDSVKQRATARPLRVRLGVADALPKLLTYHIIKPIFHLPQPVQVSCLETNVSDMWAN